MKLLSCHFIMAAETKLLKETVECGMDRPQTGQNERVENSQRYRSNSVQAAFYPVEASASDSDSARLGLLITALYP